MSSYPRPLYLLFLLSCLFGMDNGRLSIIPEYDYNGVTILFSGQRDSTNIGKLLSVTVPANTDSVFRIITSDNKFSFIIRSTKQRVKINGWNPLKSDHYSMSRDISF